MINEQEKLQGHHSLAGVEHRHPVSGFSSPRRYRAGRVRFRCKGKYLKGNGVPYGSRTRVAAVKGRCPRPLDERDAWATSRYVNAPFGGCQMHASRANRGVVLMSGDREKYARSTRKSRHGTRCGAGAGCQRGRAGVSYAALFYRPSARGALVACLTVADGRKEISVKWTSKRLTLTCLTRCV